MFFNAIFEPLSRVTGVHPDQLRYVAFMIAIYPLSSLYYKRVLFNPRIPAVFKTAVHVIGGNLLLFANFHVSSVAHIYTMIVLSYLLIIARVKPLWTLVFGMGYLSIRQRGYPSHLLKMYEAYGAYMLDHTGPMMLLVIKLSSLAFDYADTHRLKDPNLIGNRNTQVRFTDFLGYMFFFPSVLAGPPMRFAEYINFSNHSMFNNNNMLDRSIVVHKRKASFKVFLGSIVALSCYAIGRQIVTLPFFYSDAYVNGNIVYKLGWLHLNAFIERCKYYFVWLVAESSMIGVGIAYTVPLDGSRACWNGMENIRPLSIEFATEFRSVISNWNIKTADWLHRYIYSRVDTGRSKASLLTYLVSAFWHGFYPGYYFTFISGAFLTILYKNLKKIVPGAIVPVPAIDTAVRFLANWIFVDYVTFPFMALKWEASVSFYRQFYFSIHLVLLVLTGLSVLALPKRKMK